MREGVSTVDHTGDGTSRDTRYSRGSSRGAGDLIALINGVLAEVGGVYVSTRSVPITVIAGIAALILAGLLVARRG